MVNVRRLAAVDLSGLGPKIIIPEFALAVLGAPALGVLTLLRSTTTGMTIFGVSLVGLGVNYVPLLVHAIDLVRRSAVMAEIAREASEPRVLYAKYRRQSLWLLLPFTVAIADVWQGLRKAASQRD